MKFVAHNHYHNNNISYYIPRKDTHVGGSSLFITKDGVAVFILSERWEENDKRNMLAALDYELRERFGNGLSAVTHGTSDCTGGVDFSGFFRAAKEANSSIKTIFVTGYKKDVNADIITNESHLLEAINQATQPNQNDRAEPAQGWWEVRDELEALIETVHAGVMNKARAAGLQSPELGL